MAHFYFTGKKLDDETGLVYFGARYYNPKIARFITADTVVQSPYNPQTLNRYSYCNNNPVSFVDPTGHSWRGFGSSLIATAKWLANVTKADPIIHGIVSGNWGYAAQVGSSAVSGFLSSGPVGAVVGVITAVVMNSPTGQWAVQEVAEDVFEPMGLSPRLSYMWSYIAVSTVVSLSVEGIYANMIAEQGTVEDFDPDNPEHMKLMKSPKYGYNTYGGPPDPTNPDATANWVASGNVKVITGADGHMALVGERPYLFGSVHTGANSPNFPQALNMKNPSFLPFQKLTTFGVCHQATNATLLASGFSNTVTQISGNYSTYISTAVYGNYGGGLVQKVYNGYQLNLIGEKRNDFMFNYHRLCGVLIMSVLVGGTLAFDGESNNQSMLPNSKIQKNVVERIIKDIQRTLPSQLRKCPITVIDIKLLRSENDSATEDWTINVCQETRYYFVHTYWLKGSYLYVVKPKEEQFTKEKKIWDAAKRFGDESTWRKALFYIDEIDAKERNK